MVRPGTGKNPTQNTSVMNKRACVNTGRVVRWVHFLVEMTDLMRNWGASFDKACFSTATAAAVPMVSHLQ